MSSERHFSSKPYRPARKKKSYWKPVLFLVLLGGLWFGYIQYWPTIEGWFKPTIHEVHRISSCVEGIKNGHSVDTEWPPGRKHLISS